MGEGRDGPEAGHHPVRGVEHAIGDRLEHRRERRQAKKVSDLVPPEAKGAPPSHGSVVRKVIVAMLTGAIFAWILFKTIPELAGYDYIWAEVSATPPVWFAGLLAIAVVILILNTAMMVLPIRGIGGGSGVHHPAGFDGHLLHGPRPVGHRGAVPDAALLRRGRGGLQPRHGGREHLDQRLHAVHAGVRRDRAVPARERRWREPVSARMGRPGGARQCGADRGLVAVLLRSLRFAQGLGRTGQTITNWALRLVRKPEVDGWVDAAVTLRENTLTVLRAHGVRLTVLTVVNYWTTGILLILCLRLVGIDSTELPISVALATYTVGRLSTVIQITPGGVGVVEVAYTAAFVAVTSASLQPTITAGVLIFRGPHLPAPDRRRSVLLPRLAPGQGPRGRCDRQP